MAKGIGVTRDEELGPCVACKATADACRKTPTICCPTCTHYNLVKTCECCGRAPAAVGSDYCDGCLLDGGKS